jgi:predicted transcriptional regulator
MRFGVTPAGSIFTGEASTVASEIAFRVARLADETDRERLAAPREGLRQRIGHALMALGRAIHGLEPDPAGRPALRAR